MKILLGVLFVIICCKTALGAQSILITNPTEIPNFNLSAEIGQPDFTSSNAGSPASNTLYFCTGVFSTSRGLYVADSSDSSGGRGRILFYPQNTITTTNTPASIVFGSGIINSQGDDSNRAYVASDAAGNVYSSILLENLVYIFAAPITQGQAAAGTLSPGTIAFNRPSQMEVDPVTQKLYVVDTGNNRVLVYPPNPTSQTQPIAVYGKSSVNSASTAGVDALVTPLSVAVDCYGGVWISTLIQGYYAIAYYPVNVTDRATYNLLAPSNPTVRRGDFGYLSSLSWDRSTCGRLLVTTSPNDFSPSVIYILSISFSGALPTLPPTTTTYILSGARNAAANPTPRTDSLISITTSVWDVNIPGYFWAGDFITHRVTLQSFNGSSLNISTINGGASPSAVAGTQSTTTSISATASPTPASVSPSSSIIPAASLTSSTSASVSVSTSASVILSASATRSTNASISASASVSASVILSASTTPSSNASISASASVILSASTTPSSNASISASASVSASFIPGASVTPSVSASVSTSLSSTTTHSATLNASTVVGTPSTTASIVASATPSFSTSVSASNNFSASATAVSSRIVASISPSTTTTATASTSISTIATASRNATLSGSNAQSLTLTASATASASFLNASRSATSITPSTSGSLPATASVSATASPNNITDGSVSSSVSLTSFPSLTPSFSFGSTPSTSESGLPPVPDASQSQAAAPARSAGATKYSWVSVLFTL